MFNKLWYTKIYIYLNFLAQRSVFCYSQWGPFNLAWVHASEVTIGIPLDSFRIWFPEEPTIFSPTLECSWRTERLQFNHQWFNNHSYIMEPLLKIPKQLGLENWAGGQMEVLGGCIWHRHGSNVPCPIHLLQQESSNFVLFQNCLVPKFFAFPYEFLNHCINFYSQKWFWLGLCWLYRSIWEELAS